MHTLDTYALVMLALGAIAFGIYLLIKGGDWTVDAAAWVAEKSGLSKLFIAATIVAFGTSAPELFTSINANLSGYPGISMGNVVGSNIANILMVVGIAAVVAPIAIRRREVTVDVLVMVGATAILALGMVYGVFGRTAGIVMVALLVAYIVYQWRANKLLEDEDDDEDGPYFDNTTMAMLTLFAGLTALVLGSEVLVQGAIAGGTAIGVPEAVIGMTVVAFGTSLPELTTCIAAARKNQSEMIVGGIVGSNIFNILSIVALTAIIQPLMVDPRFLGFDLPMVIVTTLILAFLLLTTGRIGRSVGVVFAAGYIAFIGFQYFGPEVSPLTAGPALGPAVGLVAD